MEVADWVGVGRAKTFVISVTPPLTTRRFSVNYRALHADFTWGTAEGWWGSGAGELVRASTLTYLTQQSISVILGGCRQTVVFRAGTRSLTSDVS